MTSALSLDLPVAVREITLEVRGIAAPKGSFRAMKNKHTGQAMLVPSNSPQNKERLRQWDANVREVAEDVVGQVDAPPFVEVALDVHIVFRIGRPASHWGPRGLKPKAPPFPIGKPDADKLGRATLDSLPGIVFDDDSRICRELFEKVYASPGKEGATITIRELVG